ncbi:MAG TPA: NAD(P)-dependent oxidoreductase [Xanthobacteraceae bacterium]|jgi:3-hydroxyisobutyrate dehydrogenase-like beta-hydroxyacid dehydrogenase
MQIGFIGVGMMGHGMAKNLLEKGFKLAVLGHRNRAPVEDLVKRGAREARDPADAAAGADIIFLCVTGSPQVEEIVYGTRGLRAAVKRGQVIVDCSTSEPVSTDRIRADFAGDGVAFVDAPLARTPKEAELGKLNVMVGVDPDVFARIKPALEAFAENIFHVGGPGRGHVMKLLNNFFALGQAALIAEVLVAGARAGADLEQLYKVVSAGGANSGIFQMLVTNILKGDDSGLPFLLRLAQKDLRYYTHLTEGLGLPSQLGECVHQAFVQASALGYGDRMVGGLIRAQEQITGTKIKTGAAG